MTENNLPVNEEVKEINGKKVEVWKGIKIKDEIF